MASSITKSGLFGIKTQDQALALMLVAQAEGRHPASVATEFDIVQGRPALKSQAALSRFQLAGGKIQWVKRTEDECAAEFSHPAGGTLTVSWTWKRAVDAGLTGKQTWKQYPIQMLSARVVAEGVRAVFPACLNGVYLAEEVQDFDARPSMTRVKSEPVQEPQTVTLIENTPVVESMKPAEVRPDFVYDETRRNSLEQIFALMEQDKVSEEMVLGFLNNKKRNPKNSEYVADISEGTLAQLVKAWDKVIAFAVENSMKEAA